MADRAVDALADQGIEGRAQGQRQAMAKTEDQDQRHAGIDGPGVQAPVEESDLHGLARRQRVTALAHRRIDEVHDRLGHAKKNIRPIPCRSRTAWRTR